MAPNTKPRTLRPAGPVEFSAGLFHCRFAGGEYPWRDRRTRLDMGRGWTITFIVEAYDPETNLWTCRILEQAHAKFVETRSMARAREA